MTNENHNKRIVWTILAMMAFSIVWGLGNTVNGYIYFNGAKVIFSWVLIFALYFIPYALMVGELGAVFQKSEGGVSSWVDATLGPKWVYYVRWTCWACHIVCIPSKGTSGLRAMAWGIWGDITHLDALPTAWIQIATLITFLFFCWIATKGLSILKTLATLAGTSMFIMSILLIIMMLIAPAVNPHAGFSNIDWNLKSLIPTSNRKYFTPLLILVFGVGDCEKISPYVNKVKDPSRGFPKAMILLVTMVIISAILGTIAVAMMFSTKEINADLNSYISNGAYWALQKLSEYYHLGNLFLYIYTWRNVIGQLAVSVLSTDAPLRMLLGSKQVKEFIPCKLLRENRYGAYINGIWMVVILSGGLALAQTLVPSSTAVIAQLIKLNSTTMPLRYLWVSAAYIALQKQTDKLTSNYKMTKNQGLALFAGFWCFFVIGFSRLVGIYSPDPFTLFLNILIPIVLTALGVILPIIRKHGDKN